MSSNLYSSRTRTTASTTTRTTLLIMLILQLSCRRGCQSFALLHHPPLLKQQASRGMTYYGTLSSTSKTTADSSLLLSSSFSSISEKEDHSLQKIVVVKRNRQSMEFRKGSQLVFEGAISYTMTTSSSSSATMDLETEDAALLKMADLVKVMVEEESTSSSSSSKSGSRFKSKNGNKNKSKSTGASTSLPSYKHYTISSVKKTDHDDATTTTTTGCPPSKPPTQLIGWGVYNPNSLYRVRILCHANIQPMLSKTIQEYTISSSNNNNDNNHDAMKALLTTKIKAAIQTRRALGLPSATTDPTGTTSTTDTYRLVNGEGDGLSGLAMDVLGGRVVVIMASAAWCQVYRSVIMETVQELFATEQQQEGGEQNDIQVIWKTTPSRLKQDGWIENNNDDGGDDVNKDDDDMDDDSIHDNDSTDDDDTTDAVICTESGIKYETFPFFKKGQKTGFYCDQRDTRIQLAQLCSNKRVLDLCCYHGGFSLTAFLLGQASHVTGVDSSEAAIDACRRNAELNGIEIDPSNESNNVEFVRDDVVHFMQQQEQGKYWDVIVLDPPKLAPSISTLDRASRKYHSMNRDAIKLINPENGGLLLTCTCSAAMTQKEGGQYFLQTIQQAAASAGRQVTLLRTSGAAPCHTQSPASYPAGAYLTAALFHVAPIK